MTKAKVAVTTIKGKKPAAAAIKADVVIGKQTSYRELAEQMVKPLFTTKANVTDYEAVRIVSEFAYRLLNKGEQSMVTFVDLKIKEYLTVRGAVSSRDGKNGKIEVKGKNGSAIVSKGTVSAYSDTKKAAVMLDFFSFQLNGKGFAAFVDNEQVFLFACRSASIVTTINAYLQYIVAIQDVTLSNAAIDKIVSVRTRENTRTRVDAMRSLSGLTAKLELQ
jgi:hypothetical protein